MLVFLAALPAQGVKEVQVHPEGNVLRVAYRLEDTSDKLYSTLRDALHAGETVEISYTAQLKTALPFSMGLLPRSLGEETVRATATFDHITDAYKLRRYESVERVFDAEKAFKAAVLRVPELRIPLSHVPETGKEFLLKFKTSVRVPSSAASRAAGGWKQWINPHHWFGQNALVEEEVYLAR